MHTTHDDSVFANEHKRKVCLVRHKVTRMREQRASLMTLISVFESLCALTPLRFIRVTRVIRADNGMRLAHVWRIYHISYIRVKTCTRAFDSMRVKGLNA